MSAFWELSKDAYTGHALFEYGDAEKQNGEAMVAQSGQLDLNTDHDFQKGLLKE